METYKISALQVPLREVTRGFLPTRPRPKKPTKPSWLSVPVANWWKNHGGATVQGLIFPLLVLGLWFMTTNEKWLPANILPSPPTVVHTFFDLLKRGELTSNLSISLWRVAQGALWGVSIGLVLGLALGFSSTVEAWIGPTFRTVAQIPPIALIPLLMMVLGIDDRLKIFIMAKSCVIPLAFTVAAGIRNIPEHYLEVARVFRLSRWTLITKVILPGALPAVFSGLRQGISHVWFSLVIVEMMASAEGIGYLMGWGRLIFQLDIVFVCIVIVGLVGFTIDFGLRLLEKHLLSWRLDKGVS